MIQECKKKNYRPLFLLLENTENEEERAEIVRKIELPGAYGFNPVFFGIYQHQADMVKILVDHYGFGLQSTHSQGLTYLQVSAMKGDYALVKFFVEKGVPVDEVCHGGFSALQLAIRQNWHGIAIYLLLNRADPFIQDKKGKNLIH